MKLPFLLLAIAAWCSLGNAHAVEPCPVPAGKYLGVGHSVLENGSLDSAKLEIEFEIRKDGKLALNNKGLNTLMILEWTGNTWIGRGPLGIPLEMKPTLRGNLLMTDYIVGGVKRADFFHARAEP